MKLELHFQARDIDRFSHTITSGFLSDQPCRFESTETHIQGGGLSDPVIGSLATYEHEHGCDNTSMIWIGDNYLHAMIVMGWYKTKLGCIAHLLTDSAEEAMGDYVVWVNMNWEERNSDAEVTE